MEQQEQVDQMPTIETMDSAAKPVAESSSENSQDEVILELAGKLQDYNFFSLQLVQEHGAEALSSALSLCWESWEANTRMIVAGHLINAYRTKSEASKSQAIPALRVGVATRILDVDPPNALRILASVALQQGAKPLKPGEISTPLCKALQKHFLQGEPEAPPRYTKLFVKDRAEEIRTIVIHLVSAMFGSNSDQRDPTLAPRQFQLLESLLQSDIFPLDEGSTTSIANAVSSWPMRMRPEASRLSRLFAERHRSSGNLFEPIIRSSAIPAEGTQAEPAAAPDGPAGQPANMAAETVPPPKTVVTAEPHTAPVGHKDSASPAGTAVDSVPSPLEPSLLDPAEALRVGLECFQRVGHELAKKQQEAKELRIAALEANHKLQTEERNHKQRLEDLRATIAALREEVSDLKSGISTQAAQISSLRQDKARLEEDLKSSQKAMGALEEARQDDARKLSEAIGSVSEHKVGEFKRSLELDLKSEYDELVPLQETTDCAFHMNTLRTIFRKLGLKGVSFGEVKQ